MLQITVSGTPYQRGYTHGKRYARLVQEHTSLRNTLMDGEAAFGDRWGQKVREIIRVVQENLESVNPEVLEELRGISEGSTVPFRELMVLNAWGTVNISTTGWHNCSNIAFIDTPDGPLLGKTNDTLLDKLRFFMLQRVHPSDGYSFVCCRWIGTVNAGAGMNEMGLAFVAASLIARKESWNWRGIPGYTFPSYLLQHAKTTEEAIRLSAKFNMITGGYSLLFADADANVARVEKLATTQAVMRGTNNVLFHTNHPLCVETIPHAAGRREFLDNSRARYRNLMILTAEAERSVAGLKGILRDHSREGGICQHGTTSGLHTTSAFIAIPSQRKVLIADGCPCEATFVEHRVDQ